MYMDDQYSVLMSVYKKDRPEYLKAAVDSILRQTLQAKDIVLICDGPLTEELDRVIMQYGSQLTVVRLQENRGLGAALSEGLLHCQCEWIARMDSDDISVHNRCELQMKFLKQHKDVDVLSGTIAEFEGACLTEDEAAQQIVSYKYVPEQHSEVARYIKYRNPVNHPGVMFRKSRVLEAGGYQPCPLFEDYDLWVRMFQNQCRFANLREPGLYMRVDGMHQRRGGIRYVKAIMNFESRMYRYHMLSGVEFIYTVAMRTGVSLLPNNFRKIIYDRKLRKHEDEY
jgi:glycosyltransferase involved in cell wall biosynthesis